MSAKSTKFFRLAVPLSSLRTTTYMSRSLTSGPRLCATSACVRLASGRSRPSSAPCGGSPFIALSRPSSRQGLRSCASSLRGQQDPHPRCDADTGGEDEDEEEAPEEEDEGGLPVVDFEKEVDKAIKRIGGRWLSLVQAGSAACGAPASLLAPSKFARFDGDYGYI